MFLPRSPRVLHDRGTARELHCLELVKTANELLPNKKAEGLNWVVGSVAGFEAEQKNFQQQSVQEPTPVAMTSVCSSYNQPRHKTSQACILYVYYVHGPYNHHEASCTGFQSSAYTSRVNAIHSSCWASCIHTYILFIHFSRYRITHLYTYIYPGVQRIQVHEPFATTKCKFLSQPPFCRMLTPQIFLPVSTCHGKLHNRFIEWNDNTLPTLITVNTLWNASPWQLTHCSWPLQGCPLCVVYIPSYLMTSPFMGLMNSLHTCYTTLVLCSQNYTGIYR